jgi:hypothetical protein
MSKRRRSSYEVISQGSNSSFSSFADEDNGSSMTTADEVDEYNRQYEKYTGYNLMHPHSHHMDRHFHDPHQHLRRINFSRPSPPSPPRKLSPKDEVLQAMQKQEELRVQDHGTEIKQIPCHLLYRNLGFGGPQEKTDSKTLSFNFKNLKNYISDLNLETLLLKMRQEQHFVSFIQETVLTAGTAVAHGTEVRLKSTEQKDQKLGPTNKEESPPSSSSSAPPTETTPKPEVAKDLLLPPQVIVERLYPSDVG